MSLTGAWEKVGAVFQNLAKGILGDATLEVMEDEAQVYVKKIKRHITRQDLNWDKLTSGTLYKKKRLGQGSKVLIATKEYLNKIGVDHISKNKVFAGASREVRHEGSGLSMADLAAIHEYGSPSKNIPARPLYEPTGREVYKDLKKNLKGKLEDVIYG